MAKQLKAYAITATILYLAAHIVPPIIQALFCSCSH